MPRISPRRRWLNSLLELLGQLFGTRSSGSSSSSGTGAAPSDSSWSLPSIASLPSSMSDWDSVSTLSSSNSSITSSSTNWSITPSTSSSASSPDFAIDAILACLTDRYFVPRDPVPKSFDWFIRVLPAYDESRFVATVRLTRATFAIVLQELWNTGQFSNRQMPLDWQASIVLYRLEHSGTGACVVEVARRFGLSEGGVVKVSNRVLRAFEDLMPR
jgi:hypothetical protein